VVDREEPGGSARTEKEEAKALTSARLYREGQEGMGRDGGGTNLPPRTLDDVRGQIAGSRAESKGDPDFEPNASARSKKQQGSTSSVSLAHFVKSIEPCRWLMDVEKEGGDDVLASRGCLGRE
jgi:hypothetical protein